MAEHDDHDSLALARNSIGHENSVSPCDKPSYLPAEHDDYDARRTEIGDDKKKPLSPSKYSHYQGEMDELRGNYFDKSSFEFEEQTFPSKSQTEDPAHSQESPLTEDANLLEEMEVNPDFDEPTTDQVTDGKDGTDHDARNSLSESEETTIRLSNPHSGVSKQSLSPVATKQMSVSPEDPSKSLASHKDKHPSSPETSGHKYPSSPVTSGLVKGTTASDHKPPSSRRTSTSPRRSQHKEGKLKPRSASPKVDRSHRNHKRSVSRSPVRKMESSSSHRKGHYGRSRSRSPNVRDHQRSPRRRYSPRRRSPGGYPPCPHSPRRRSPGGYHGRHRSPRRKHWSPPPNRRTGLGKPGNNLFVAGFNFLTTERDLERKFSRFGRVRDVRIVRDRRSGDSRGFGFLSLEKDEEADAAIRALDETEWDGRIILVEKSKST